LRGDKEDKSLYFFILECIFYLFNPLLVFFSSFFLNNSLKIKEISKSIRHYKQKVWKDRKKVGIHFIYILDKKKINIYIYIQQKEKAKIHQTEKLKRENRPTKIK
jgi:hypothetical protein